MFEQNQVVVASRGKDDKKKFRLRPAIEGSNHVVETPGIILRDVQFETTTEKPEYNLERGFGCQIAAVGHVSFSPLDPSEVIRVQRIRFDGKYNFWTLDEYGRNADLVTSVKLLILGEHEVLAIL